MEPQRWFYIVILAVFVISGRKFLDAWRDNDKRGRQRRILYGSLCLGGFLIVAFFEVQL